PAEPQAEDRNGSAGASPSHDPVSQNPPSRIASDRAAFNDRLIATIESLEHREQGTTPMLLDIEKLLILKTVPIFAEAPDHVLAQVVSILEEQEFAAEQRVFEKGDLGTSMYVIVSGKVRVHLDDRELTVLGERQVFGELALLDPEPRSASVTATEPTLLFKISQSAIYELMANHIEITRGIMKVLCRRIRQVK
ncbi:MAG: cyclic nucleotide-binding domain-containing protein, partial [Planctomycetaceae bacterium]